MKTLTSITCGLSILSISLLLIVSFTVEASAKRGCSAFGHSCFGGHGKRSTANNQISLNREDVDSSRTNVVRHSNVNDVVTNYDGNEIKELRDFMKCRNCAVKGPRRASDEDYVPLLVRQLLGSYRRSYDSDLTSSNE